MPLEIIINELDVISTYKHSLPVNVELAHTPQIIHQGKSHDYHNKFLNGLLYCPPDLFVLMPPPILEFPILVNSLYLLPEQQLILTHFLLVLLDCGTVYQQIMYIMTLLDNLKSVFKILSYALRLLHLY